MALLDLDNANPWSRLQRSEYRTLEGLRQYVDRFVKTERCARACVSCCVWLWLLWLLWLWLWLFCARGMCHARH